jgi:L-threonylcarbamoyladenylate synthase
MFFSLEAALTALDGLSEGERVVLEGLLPGPVTLLLANRGQLYLPACREDPGTLGLRVPRLPARLAALGHLRRPVMQSSANLSGEPDARTVEQVPRSLRASTVIDMRDFETEGRWHLLREGALGRQELESVLASLT